MSRRSAAWSRRCERFGEAVILVETVRLYRDMLKRLDAQNSLYQLPPVHWRNLLGGLLKQ